MKRLSLLHLALALAVSYSPLTVGNENYFPYGGVPKERPDIVDVEDPVFKETDTLFSPDVYYQFSLNEKQKAAIQKRMKLAE